jgi:hypothetical protein
MADDKALTGDVFEDIAAFHKKFGFGNVLMTKTFLAFRLRFLFEELMECVDSADNGSAGDLVDGLIDLMVVAAGTLDIAGVNGQEAWDRVMAANMAKERGANASRPGSNGADLVKPPGWTAPYHYDNAGTLKYGVGDGFNKEFSHPILTLMHCIHLQIKKGGDYQAAFARADYFIHGIDDLEYEINKKHMRFRSLLDKLRNGKAPNYESIVDSLMDSINYASFAISWVLGALDGQDKGKDLFGKPLLETAWVPEEGEAGR